MNEADTCRKQVVPKLQNAGWDADPHSIAGRRKSEYPRQFVRKISAGVGETKRSERNPMKRLQAETAADLAALLPAILDNAFKGEL